MTHTTDPDPIQDVHALRLVETARDMQLRAYAPYSRYHVGAAALGDDGVIYGGCNIENASYSLCNCAERVAIASAIAAGCKSIVAIAVVTKDGGSPCGSCRQVMTEFNPAMLVYIINADGESARVTTAEALLPDYFKLP